MVYNRFNMKEKNKRAWVVAADMGYGHQRTAYPLRDIAFGEKVINANSYHGIPKKDRNIWEQTRSLYEVVSRLKKIPCQWFPLFLLRPLWRKNKIIQVKFIV